VGARGMDGECELESEWIGWKSWFYDSLLRG
jgi:hypothetical protein